MFIFGKVKFVFAMMLTSVFLAGVSVGSSFYDGWVHLLVVPLHVFGFVTLFYVMSTRMADRMHETSQIICAEQQAKLLVSMHDSGVLLDPDFESVVQLSRLVLEDMEKLRNG